MKRFLTMFFPLLMLIGASSPNRDERISSAIELSLTEPVRAEAILKDLAAKYPDWDYPHVLLGDIYFHSFALDEGIREFEKALKLSGNLPSYQAFKIRKRLADLYIRKGDLRNSVSNWKIALRLRSTDSGLSNNLVCAARLNSALSNPDSDTRISELTAILALRPDWLSARLELATLLASSGDTVSAGEEVDALLDFIPVSSVNVIGRFRDTKTTSSSIPMKYAGEGIWSADIPLRKGPNEYRFMVNGNRPLVDEHNTNGLYGMPGFQVLFSGQDASVHTFWYQSLPLDPLVLKTLRLADRWNRSYPLFFLSNFVATNDPDVPVPVEFRFPSTNQNLIIRVAGNFNNFLRNMNDQDRYRLNWNGEAYSLTLLLKPGRYYYEFRQEDGTRFQDSQAADWFVDPKEGNVFSALSAGGYTPCPNRLIPCEFEFGADNIKSVSVVVAGSFNYWGGTAYGLKFRLEKLALTMRPDATGSKFSASTKLPMGRMQYKFVVNGQNWIPDPNRLERQSDGFGTGSSVVPVRHPAYEAEKLRFRTENPKKFRFRFDPSDYPGIFRKNAQNSWEVLPPQTGVIDWVTWNGGSNISVSLSADYPGNAGFAQWTWPDDNPGHLTEWLPVKIAETVLFRIKKPHAEKVNLVGDFNRWDRQATPMNGPDENGWWSVRLTLSPGKYQYKFLIDGVTFLQDTFNTNFTKDGNGGWNSIVRVQSSETLSGLKSTLFRFRAPQAKSVHLAGSFNQWNLEEIPLSGPEKSGWWSVRLRLPDGEHEFFYIVDGKYFATDPSIRDIRMDRFGGRVSVIRVTNENRFTEKVPVSFRLSSESASNVAVCGNFSGWETADALPMKKLDKSGWTTDIEMSPGTWEYQFLIDGNFRVPDPAALKIADSYSGSRSRIFVLPPGVSLPDSAASMRFRKGQKISEVYLVTEESGWMPAPSQRFSPAEGGSWKYEWTTGKSLVKYNILVVTDRGSRIIPSENEPDGWFQNASGGVNYVRIEE